MNARLVCCCFAGVVGVLVLITQANAVIYRAGQFGPGGLTNAYTVETTTKTWDQARYDATQTSASGVSGHLATIGGAAENVFVDSLGSSDQWIGLTDATAISTIDGFDPATSLGTAEFGATHALAYPAAGNTPSDEAGTQRGEGWAWVTGEPLVYQSWNSAEPNDSGSNEDAGHIRNGGGWNDHRAGTSIGNTDHNLQSIIEYDLPAHLSDLLWYREVKANSQFPGSTTGQVRSLADAEALLALRTGDLGYGGEALGFVDQVNLLNSGGDGRYGSNDPFLIGGDHYTSEVTGQVYIPTAGEWTFGTNTDDGSGLWVGPFSKINDVLSGAHDHLAVFDFASEGWYDLRLVFFEATGGAEVELFAALGNHTAWNATDFDLVGDTVNGGLAVRAFNTPEPSTVAMLLGLAGVGLLGYLRRRRR